MNSRVSRSNSAYVALEVADINRVETDLMGIKLSNRYFGTGGRILTIVTQSLTSASVSWSPMRKSLPVKIFSSLSKDSNNARTAFWYASCEVAKPALYTPSSRR